MSMSMMKRLFSPVGIILVVSALLCGCDPGRSASSAPAVSTANTPPSHETSAVAPATTAGSARVDDFLKKDLAYADARKALLAHGWMPDKDMQCNANVGANKKLCESSPASNLCTVCSEMPELSAYSDEGLAVTHFKRGAQRLTLDSSGSLSDWKIQGDNSRLAVTNWRITTVVSPPKTPNP